MNRRLLALCFVMLLALFPASRSFAAAPVFHVDNDSDCADQSRQANTIVGGWAGFANQAHMILWLQLDPSIDPTLANVYSLDVVHQGTTVITGQVIQFIAICSSPNAQWRYAELVYGGFISGGVYSFVLHDPSGNTLGSDSARLIDGPGI